MSEQAIVIYDQFDQAWRIFEEEELFEEAKLAVAQANGQKVYWPLAKLVEKRGYGWWTTFKRLDEFEADLAKVVPNPGSGRLLDLYKEYTPDEMRSMLQCYGSYISTLHHTEAMIEAQYIALKQGLKTGMNVMVSQYQGSQTTIAGKEGEIISDNELMRNTRRMEIDHEAFLTLIKGWREAYQQAWSTISRIISLKIGESSLQSDRAT